MVRAGPIEAIGSSMGRLDSYRATEMYGDNGWDGLAWAVMVFIVWTLCGKWSVSIIACLHSAADT